MNIVKELTKTAKANYQRQLNEAEAALESVKANLSMQDGDDHSMLQFFGTNQVVAQQTYKAGEAKRMLSGEQLSEADVKAICVKYCLRCLPTEHYKKEVPLRALNDLKLFRDKNNLRPDQLQHGLRIIAPASHFELGPRPPKDPVLLFKRGDNYEIISQWGSDFSPLRRATGFFMEHKYLLLFFGIVISLNIVFTVKTIEDSENAPFFVFNGLFIWLFFGLDLFVDNWKTSSLYNKPHK